MNETRRKEIETIIERLNGIRSEIHQIRIADSLSKCAPDFRLESAQAGVEWAVNDLTRELGL